MPLDLIRLPLLFILYGYSYYLYYRILYTLMVLNKYVYGSKLLSIIQLQLTF